MLATCDGSQPRVRPITVLKYVGFVVYFASRTRFHKVVELERNNRVELCFLAERHDQLRITGLAERVFDAALIQEIWYSTPLLREWLGVIENPEFLLYRVIPSQVRYMREWSLEYVELDE
jgi:general stress protein 26